MKRKSLQPIIIGLTILIVVIVITTIILYIKPKKSAKNNKPETYNEYELDPHTLDKGFKVTPEKMCSGGPYMVSSAPEEVKQTCYNYSVNEMY